MEVASPLPLSHGRRSAKRSFAFSPPFADASDPNQATAAQSDCAMESDDYPQQPFKRRRFLTEGTTSDQSRACLPMFSSSSASQFGSPKAATSTKRTRTDNGWNQAHAKKQIALEMQKMVDQQVAEIDRLKSEKASIESTCAGLTSQNEKVVGENRILKRAVTIQQERQNQALSEIDAARKYRNEAEERIRRLEQMNLTLQFHLQQQQPCNGNDFMGFSPRPPDIC